jgi:hypothetical protein
MFWYLASFYFNLVLEEQIIKAECKKENYSHNKD